MDINPVSHIRPARTDLTIGGLVRRCDVSVRLTHCIAASPEISELTIPEFLADPAKWLNRFLRTRNAGQKTASELSALMAKAAADLGTFCTDPVLNQAPPRKAPPREIAFGILVDLLKPIPFPAALLEIEISARLRNCLETIQATRLTAESWEPEADNLGAVLAEWPRIRPKLLKQANLGRKTVAELEAVIEKITWARVNACCPSAGLPETRIDDLSENQLDETLIELLVSADAAEIRDTLAQNQPELSTLLHGPDDDDLSPREQVRETVSQLTQKQQDVIVRRYGLDGRRPETLEGVAAQFHVTRERVRQVEAKALERLKLGANRRALERLLTAEQQDVWNLLTQGHPLLLPSDLQDRRPGIPGEFMLAVDVVHRRLVDWVASYGRAVLGGWRRGDDDTGDVEESVQRARIWAATASGPVPLASAAEHSGVPARHLAVALKLRPDIHEFEGYICPGHLGAQAKRTCRLHAIALRFGGFRAFDVATLRAAYVSAHTGDKVFPRVINQQLQRAPHLFFRIFDGIWTAFGSDTDIGGCTMEEIPFERTPVPGDTDFGSESIGGWLCSTLALNGPMRTVDLRAEAETKFQNGISQSSVGAVLQSNDDFVRLAPGVFGLQRHVAALADPAIPIPSSMLTDAQCRHYAMSRHAGDPISLYPAWSHRLEAALCRWASTSASGDGYRSMLSVSDIPSWGVDPAEAAVWQERKRHHGSFRLPRPDPQQAPQLPSAADFLAAAMYLVLTGSIAWTTVNRTAQRQINSHKAAATLALLVRFGMAASTEPWHGRHKALPPATATVSEIVADLTRTGKLSWNEGVLANLRNRPPCGYVGWIDVVQLEKILAGGDEAADKGLMMGNGTPTDLDAIFGSDDWGATFLSETD